MILKGRFQPSSLESPFTYILVLFYRLDPLAAFFQYLFQFLHGSGSQHGDSRLAEIRDALEDRGGGKVATGVENASVLVYALHVDAQLLLQEVNLLTTASCTSAESMIKALESEKSWRRTRTRHSPCSKVLRY